MLNQKKWLLDLIETLLSMLKEFPRVLQHEKLIYEMKSIRN